MLGITLKRSKSAMEATSSEYLALQKPSPQIQTKRDPHSEDSLLPAVDPVGYNDVLSVLNKRFPPEISMHILSYDICTPVRYVIQRSPNNAYTLVETYPYKILWHLGPWHGRFYTIRTTSILHRLDDGSLEPEQASLVDSLAQMRHERRAFKRWRKGKLPEANVKISAVAVAVTRASSTWAGDWRSKIWLYSCSGENTAQSRRDLGVLNDRGELIGSLDWVGKTEGVWWLRRGMSEEVDKFLDEMLWCGAFGVAVRKTPGFFVKAEIAVYAY